MKGKINYILKSEIESKHKRIRRFAELIGFNLTTLSLKLNGHNDFTESEIIKICNHFEKTPIELFFLDFK